MSKSTTTFERKIAFLAKRYAQGLDRLAAHPEAAKIPLDKAALLGSEEGRLAFLREVSEKADPTFNRTGACTEPFVRWLCLRADARRIARMQEQGFPTQHLGILWEDIARARPEMEVAERCKREIPEDRRNFLALDSYAAVFEAIRPILDRKRADLEAQEARMEAQDPGADGQAVETERDSTPFLNPEAEMLRRTAMSKRDLKRALSLEMRSPERVLILARRADGTPAVVVPRRPGAEETDSYALKALDAKAGTWWGQGARWCTVGDRAEDTYASYAESGDLTIFLAEDGRKFQGHLDAGSGEVTLMDAEDNPHPASLVVAACPQALDSPQVRALLLCADMNGVHEDGRTALSEDSLTRRLLPCLSVSAPERLRTISEGEKDTVAHLASMLPTEPTVVRGFRAQPLLGFPLADLCPSLSVEQAAVLCSGNPALVAHLRPEVARDAKVIAAVLGPRHRSTATLGLIPEDARDTPTCRLAVARNVDNAAFVPEPSLTDELATQIAASGGLQYIDAARQTQEHVRLAALVRPESIACANPSLLTPAFRQRLAAEVPDALMVLPQPTEAEVLAGVAAPRGETPRLTLLSRLAPIPRRAMDAFLKAARADGTLAEEFNRHIAQRWRHGPDPTDDVSPFLRLDSWHPSPALLVDAFDALARPGTARNTAERLAASLLLQGTFPTLAQTDDPHLAQSASAVAEAAVAASGTLISSIPANFKTPALYALAASDPWHILSGEGPPLPWAESGPDGTSLIAIALESQRKVLDATGSPEGIHKVLASLLERHDGFALLFSAKDAEGRTLVETLPALLAEVEAKTTPTSPAQRVRADGLEPISVLTHGAHADAAALAPAFLRALTHAAEQRRPIQTEDLPSDFWANPKALESLPKRMRTDRATLTHLCESGRALGSLPDNAATAGVVLSVVRGESAGPSGKAPSLSMHDAPIRWTDKVEGGGLLLAEALRAVRLDEPGLGALETTRRVGVLREIVRKTAPKKSTAQATQEAIPFLRDRDGVEVRERYRHALPVLEAIRVHPETSKEDAVALRQTAETLGKRIAFADGVAGRLRRAETTSGMSETHAKIMAYADKAGMAQAKKAVAAFATGYLPVEDHLKALGLVLTRAPHPLMGGRSEAISTTALSPGSLGMAPKGQEDPAALPADPFMGFDAEAAFGPGLPFKKEEKEEPEKALAGGVGASGLPKVPRKEGPGEPPVQGNLFASLFDPPSSSDDGRRIGTGLRRAHSAASISADSPHGTPGLASKGRGA